MQNIHMWLFLWIFCLDRRYQQYTRSPIFWLKSSVWSPLEILSQRSGQAEFSPLASFLSWRADLANMEDDVPDDGGVEIKSEKAYGE